MSVVTRAREQALALFFLVVGTAALVLAARIPETGFQNEFDPGSRLVPTLMGAALVVGGVLEGVRAAKKRTDAEGRPQEDHGRLGLLLLLLGAYVASLPYLGFSIATMAALVVITRVMGSHWRVAIALALGLVLGVHLLFVFLFRVPLPSSAWGLPG